MESLFGQAILMNLRALKRQRLRLPRRIPRPARWAWPRALERRYAKLIREAIQAFATAIYPDAEAIARRWGARADSAGDELEALRMQAELLMTQTFGRDFAAEIARISGQLDMFVGEQFSRTADMAIGRRWDPADTRSMNAIRDWEQNNYQLVKSIPAEHMKRLNQTISDGVSQGRLWTDIAKEVQEIGPALTKQKAELIARDQIGKLNSTLTREKQQGAGIDLYEWQTSRDERVRDSHQVMEGLICRWDDRDLYSDDGGKTWKIRTSEMPIAHPGEEIQCRCTAGAYFAELLEEAIQEVEAEG